MGNGGKEMEKTSGNTGIIRNWTVFEQVKTFSNSDRIERSSNHEVFKSSWLEKTWPSKLTDELKRR